MPSPSELTSLTQLADTLFRAGACPAHVKNAGQALYLFLAGREMGIGPAQSLRALSSVKGKITADAGLQLALFKRDGGTAVFERLDDKNAVLRLTLPNGDTHNETFTWEDARRAGLINDMYNKHPKAMLRSRCITAGLKSVGYEPCSGVYDPSELADDPVADTPIAGAGTDATEPDLAAPGASAETMDAIDGLAAALGEKAVAYVSSIRASLEASESTAQAQLRKLSRRLEKQSAAAPQHPAVAAAIAPLNPDAITPATLAEVRSAFTAMDAVANDDRSIALVLRGALSVAEDITTSEHHAQQWLQDTAPAVAQARALAA